MRSYLLAMLALLLLGGLARADAYTIQVSQATNLRRGPTLKSAVVLAAYSGQTLRVIGRQADWLQVENGGRQLWMAAWVGHKRLADAPLEAGCCAPAHIALEGTQHFQQMLRRAFAWMRHSAPGWYDYVSSSGLRRVRMVPAAAVSGLSVPSMTYILGNHGVYPAGERDVLHTAGGLVHEACHAHQWADGQSSAIGWQNELPCVQVQLALTAALDPSDRYRIGAWLRYLIVHIEDPKIQWW